MSRSRRLGAATLAALVLCATALTAPAALAGGKCSPGQHGNPQPGFKPGSC